MISILANWLLYLLGAVRQSRALRFGCDLAVLQRNRCDDALCVLFRYLNKVIQVHQLIGYEGRKWIRERKQNVLLIISSVVVVLYAPSLLTMLSNTFWAWPEVGTGILLVAPTNGEK